VPTSDYRVCLLTKFLGSAAEALAVAWHRPIPLLAQELPRTAMQYTVDSQRFDSDWDTMIQLLLEMGVSTINREVVDSDKRLGFSPALRHVNVVYYVVPGC
jgi:hypothetical protein